MRHVTWLDVFTSEPLTGNALAVVHDADDLDDATMLRIARETRQSETTFVQTATVDGADYRNRIFTPDGELPFAGHPSLGTAVAVAHRAGRSEARYVQQTHAGCQPVEVRLDGAQGHASMLQEPPVYGPEVDVLAASGLAAGDLDPKRPAQVISTGVPHVIAPVTSPAVLADVAPAPGPLRELLEPHDAVALYLAAPDGDRWRARSFLPSGGGVIEDPATGSAAGPLLALLRAETLTVDQGVEMGRPGVISCSWEDDRPRVAGDVVVVLTGQVV